MDFYTTYYTYNGNDYDIADYEMTFDSSNSYGKVIVTNKAIESYALPETGGTGTMPFSIAGASIISAAFLGREFYRKRRKKSY